MSRGRAATPSCSRGSGGVRALGVELGLDRMRRRWRALGDPQRAVRGRPDRRHQRQGLDGRDDRGDPARGGPAHRRSTRRRTWRASPSASAIDGREADGDRLAALDRRVVATGVPLTYFEVATALAFLAIAEARRRRRGARDRARRPARRGDDVRAAAPRRSPRSASTTPTTSATRWRRSRARRPASSSPASRASLGRLPAEADDEIARAARRRRARRCSASARDFGPPPFADRARGRAPARQRRARGRARARGRPRSSAGRSTIGARGARAGRRALARARCERVGDDLLLDCAHNADGARALAAALPGAGAGPPRRAAGVDRRRQGRRRRCWRRWRRSRRAVVATRSDNPRALARRGAGGDRPARFVADAVAVRRCRRAALDEARRRAGPGGLVVVCGSMFLVGHAARARARRARRPAPDVRSRVQRMSISST